MRRFLVLTHTVVILAAAASAAGPSIRAARSASEATRDAGSPVAGFALNGSDLRAVLGIPGASRWSEPLTLPESTTSLRLAPGQKYALAGIAGGMAVLDLDALLVGETVLAAIPEAMGEASMVAFSPSGRSVTLYGGGHVQVLTGLPESPQVVRELDAPEGIRLLAVSDDGEAVLAAAGDGVYTLGAAGARLIAGGDISAMAFFPASGDAVICDRATQSAMRIGNVAGTAGVELLAGPVEGLEQASAAAVTSDSRTVLVASAGKIWQLQLDSGSAEPVDVAGSGTLSLLRSRDSYLVSARSDEPAWMFVREPSSPAVYFVPALAKQVPVEGEAPAK